MPEEIKMQSQVINNNKRNNQNIGNKKIYHLEKEAKGIFGKKWDKRNFEIENRKLVWKKGDEVKGKLDLDSVENVIKNRNSIILKCKSTGCEIERMNKENTNMSRKELKIRGENKNE